MGADCAAAWLGALVLTASSFVPAIMAPTFKARDAAGRVARLSLPVTALAVLWTTLSTLQLAPPQGGAFAYVVSLLLMAPVALSAWGAGLIARAALRYWLGWRVPHGATLALGICSVALMLVVR
jgi:hypothetical protein